MRKLILHDVFTFSKKTLKTQLKYYIIIIARLKFHPSYWVGNMTKILYYDLSNFISR